MKESQLFYLFLQMSDSIYIRYRYHQREFCVNNVLAELAHNLYLNLFEISNRIQSTHLLTAPMSDNITSNLPRESGSGSMVLQHVVQNTQSVNVIQAGTYSVTVSDSKGCIGVSTPFVIGNGVKPSVNAGK